VLHLRQKRVALLPAERPGGDCMAEQNLDVDLMVRHVDAGRVVDRVGVDAPALARVSDPAALGHGEVGAFADYRRSDLAAVDANRVVGTVAALRVALRWRLDIGSYAAKPQ